MEVREWTKEDIEKLLKLLKELGIIETIAEGRNLLKQNALKVWSLGIKQDNYDCRRVY